MKAKAKQIKDTFTKHGHGPDHDHDLDEKDDDDDDDDEVVEEPEIHGAPSMLPSLHRLFSPLLLLLYI